MNNQLRSNLASLFILFSITLVSFAANTPQSTLAIVGTELDPHGQLHLRLRNEKHAPVCAFSVRYPDGQLVIQEFLPPKQTGIFPGATYDFVVTSDTSTNESAFTITAVLLTDGVGDGLSHDLDEINTLRAGRAYRLKQLAPVLETLRHSPNETFVEDLHRAADAIKNMPLTLEDGTQATGLFANGMQSAGTLTANELRKAEVVLRSAPVTADTPTRLLDNIISDHKVTVAALEKGTR